MSNLAPKIHMRTVRRYIAWLLLTVIMVTHVDVVSMMQAIGAEKSKNWDVEYYLTAEDDQDEGIPIPEEEGLSTLQASASDTVYFNMFLSDLGSPDHKRFDETFTITMPEWLYQELTDYGSVPLALGETDATECGYLLEEVLETADDKGTESNATEGNASVSSATASDADSDTGKVELRFVEELRKADDPKDIEIEEQWITLSFDVPFDTTVTSMQDGNDCEISFAFAIASASNLVRTTMLRSSNSVFLVEWTLTVNGTKINAGETVSIPVGATVEFNYEVSVAAGKTPTADDWDDFEYTITIPIALYEMMTGIGGSIDWPDISGGTLFEEPIVPQKSSADSNSYNLVLTFSDATKEKLAKGDALIGAEGYFTFATEEKIDLIYEVNKDGDSTIITYEPTVEVNPSIAVTKSIRSIFNKTAYLGNTSTLSVNAGDYVIYTIALTLRNGVAGEEYVIPAGSIYESFHGGVYEYVDMTLAATKTEIEGIIDATGYSITSSQKSEIKTLFVNPLSQGRLAWQTAGTIPSSVPNYDNPAYKKMTNTNAITLKKGTTDTLNLYICLKVTEGISSYDNTVATANLKNRVYSVTEGDSSPASGVGPSKSTAFYDAAIQIFPSTVWRVSDPTTGAGIPVQIGSPYDYTSTSNVFTNENAAVHPGDFVTFVVAPYMQGSAASFVRSIDIYLPLGFEPVATSDLPTDYKFYYNNAAGADLYNKGSTSHYDLSARFQETHSFNDPTVSYNDLYEVKRYTVTWNDANALNAPRFYFTCRVKDMNPFLEAADMEPDDQDDNELGQRYCYLVSAEISALLDENKTLLVDGDEDSFTDNDPFNDWHNYVTGKLKDDLLYLNRTGEIDASYTSPHVRSKSGAYTTTVGPERDEDDFDYAILWLYDDKKDEMPEEAVLKEIVDIDSATTTKIESMMAALAAMDDTVSIYKDYALPESGKVRQTQTIVPYCVTVNSLGVMQGMEDVTLVDELPGSMKFLCTPSGYPVVEIYEVIETGGYRFPGVNEKGESITYIRPDYCDSYQVKAPLAQEYVTPSVSGYYRPGGITVDGNWDSSVNTDGDKLTINFGDIEDNYYQVVYYAIVEKVSNSYENNAVLTWNGDHTVDISAVISYSDKGSVSSFYGKLVSLEGEDYSLTAQLPADSEDVTLYYRLHIEMTTSNGTLSYAVGDLYFEDHISDLLGDSSKISVDAIEFGDIDGPSGATTRFEAKYDDQEQKLIITNTEKITESVDEYIYFRVTYDGISYGNTIRNTFGVTTTVKTPLKLDLQKIDGESEEGLGGVKFELTYDDSDPVLDGSGTAITLTTDKDEMTSVSFIPDSTKQDSDGIYTLYLTEVENTIPTGYFGLGGKDDNPVPGYAIKIIVEEDANGQYSYRAAETGQEDYYEISTGSANEIQVTAKNYKWPKKEVVFDIELTKKLLEYGSGDELKVGNEYTFTVELDDDYGNAVVIPGNTVVNNTSVNKEAVIQFQNITIKEAGTYVFKVTENVPVAADYPVGHNADSYDSGTIYVTVEVVQGPSGLGVVSVSYEKELESGKEDYYDENDAIKDRTFINYMYPTTEDEVKFELTKKLLPSLSGEELQIENGNEYEYTFTVELEEEDDAVVGIPSVGTAKITSDNTEVVIQFQDITITKVGTYVFKVTEDVPLVSIYPEGHNADSYDPGTIYVTVEVVQGAEGLVAKVVSYEKELVEGKEQYADDDNPDSTFVNFMYPTTPVPVEFDLTKKLLSYVGSVAQEVENEYTFTVELFSGENDEVSITGDTAANSISSSTEAKIEFQDIIISKVGYYIFKVTENVPAPYHEGHNADSYDPGIIYVGVKVVQGTDGLVVEEVFYLKILELDKGQYYDAQNPNSTFINYKYPTTEAEVEIDLTKKLLAATDGSELEVENEYTFTLELMEGNAADVDIPVATAANASGSTAATIQFGDIKFRKVGTYVFKITEDHPLTYPSGHNGDSYDPGTIEVTVKVVQGINGLEVEDISYKKKLAPGEEQYYDEEAVNPDGTFVNFWYPAAEIDIDLTKKLLTSSDGRELPVEQEYTFTLKLKEGNAADVEIPNSTTATDGSGSTAAQIQFKDIKIWNPGTYVFEITEKRPSTYPAGHNASSYDPGTIEVTVTLERQDGFLVVTDRSYDKNLLADKEQYYDEDAEDRNSTFINFLNPEDAPSLASVKMQAQKSLVGRTMAGNDFGFEAALIYSSPTADIKKVTTANDANGKVIFPALNFDQEGTYIFSISEQTGNTADIVYDKNIYYAEVIAERDRFGTMHCTLTYGSSYNITTHEISGHIEMPTFVNTVRGYLNIRKVSWSSGTSLSGAEFELRYRNKGSEDEWIGYGGTLVTAGSDGSLNLELPEKYWNYEYKLTETKAPSGYSNSRVGTILFTMLQNGTIDTWSSDGTTGYVELSAGNITLIVKNHTTGGGGGGDGGGTTPVTPTTPTNPEDPTIPTTPAAPDLPPVTPGHNVVPDGDRSYYELDENGVALGRWYQDEDGTWIFDEMVPLAGLARTGEQNAQWLMLLILMSGLGGAALVCKRRKDEEA